MVKSWKYNVAGLLLIALAVVLLTYFFFNTYSVTEKSNASSRQRSGENGKRGLSRVAVTNHAEDDVVEALRALSRSADPLQAPELSRRYIASIRSSQEAAGVHRKLTAILLDRLSKLSTTAEHRRDPDRVRIAIEEIADRYYLLDKLVKKYKLDTLGKGSIPVTARAQAESLIVDWNDDTRFSIIVDNEFNKRGLLVGREHMRDLFREWME